MEETHTAAVEQAIASVSPRIAYTCTGHAGAAVVDVDGVFGIRYRHRTGRALDPQLHDHVLISNAVRTVSDGEWRALDTRGLYGLLMALVPAMMFEQSISSNVQLGGL